MSVLVASSDIDVVSVKLTSWDDIDLSIPG